MLHGHVVDGHVHLGTFQVPGAGHLEEGAAAAAYVRPHDVRVSTTEETPAPQGRSSGRRRSGGSRASIRLPGGETLVAHVPHDELGDAKEGDEVWVDLRSPKAFQREEAEEVVPASAPVVSPGCEPSVRRRRNRVRRHPRGCPSVCHAPRGSPHPAPPGERSLGGDRLRHGRDRDARGQRHPDRDVREDRLTRPASAGDSPAGNDDARRLRASTSRRTALSRCRT